MTMNSCGGTCTTWPLCSIECVHSFFMFVFHLVVLTEQNDDADQYCDDGPSAKAGGSYSPRGAAVPVLITGTHFDSDHGAVGQGRVPRVGHDDGDIVHPCLQVGNLQPQLGVVTWTEGQKREQSQMSGKRESGGEGGGEGSHEGAETEWRRGKWD